MGNADSDNKMPFTVESTGDRKLLWNLAKEEHTLTVNFCEPLITDPESYCCHESNLVTTQLQDQSESEDASASHLTSCLASRFIYLWILSIFHLMVGYSSALQRASLLLIWRWFYIILQRNFQCKH